MGGGIRPPQHRSQAGGNCAGRDKVNLENGPGPGAQGTGFRQGRLSAVP